jgi:RNA polymerase I-specific transcription initiation factor RRN3
MFQSAIAYIASLIARAKFVRLSVLMACLEKLVTWIHSYINNREPNMSNDFMFVDIKSHGAFYAACQVSLLNTSSVWGG